MKHPSRRAVLVAAGAVALAACDNSVGANGADVIDRRVGQTLDFLFENHPDTRQLADQAAGMLVMPLIGEAGFVVGGSYGEGALLIDGLSVDYYSATQASVGFQIGVQQYAHVIFFMTPDALRRFRTSPGWTGGADAEVTLDTFGATLTADTLASGQPVIAVIFAQTGIRAGATLAGTKYTRILR